MFVAFRMATDEDGCQRMCIAHCSGGDAIHSEIVIPYACDRLKCPYHTEKARLLNSDAHLLTYTSHSLPRADARVSVTADRHLLPIQTYKYIRIELNPREVAIVKEYLDQQVGKRFNYCGFFCNFLTCFRCRSSSRWFCSELCVAALQQVGRLTDYDPCKVSPRELFDILIANGGKTVESLSNRSPPPMHVVLL